MLMKALGLAAVGLSLFSAFQTHSLNSAKKELKIQEDLNLKLQIKVRESEEARAKERAQCAASLESEILRFEEEIEKAGQAAIARSKITGNCPKATTAAERREALRKNSGERP